MSDTIWCEAHQSNAPRDQLESGSPCWFMLFAYRGQDVEFGSNHLPCRMVERYLVSPTALIIERDDSGEWNEDLAYMLGSSKCDWRSKQYAPDKIANGRKILDALASSQREGT